MFIVLYRTGGAGSQLRKYTIGPYGRVTLHQARVAAQKVFAAKLAGRDPAAEKREAKRRAVADRVGDLAQNRSAAESSRLLRREVGTPWAGRSVHAISKRDVVELISAIVQRGAPGAANKTLKSLKTFLRWCVGQAVLDRSPAEGPPRRCPRCARTRTRRARARSSRPAAPLRSCRPPLMDPPLPHSESRTTGSSRGALWRVVVTHLRCSASRVRGR